MTSGRRHPAEVTEGDLFAWCTATAANNSVRQRLSTVRTFFAWCLRAGHVSTDPTLALDILKREYPKTYGKVQGKQPARWLTRDQAFGTLLDACKDGTWIGSRDQVAIRLGLLGIRSAELTRMTWGNLTPDGRLVWIGKGRKERTVTPGPTLTDLLARWKRRYAAELGRELTPPDPILCREVIGRPPGQRRLAWGQPMAPRTFSHALQTRATAAGLGHVAPHDLRRTAAGILHNDKTPDGGHRYDLEDIRAVLDHADPATTQRSYIDPMGSAEVKTRAGIDLD